MFHFFQEYGDMIGEIHTKSISDHVYAMIEKHILGNFLPAGGQDQRTVPPKRCPWRIFRF